MCSAWIDVITTDRLRLRPPQPADAGRIAELANDAELAGMTAALPHPYALGDAQAWLSQQGDPASPERNFAIELGGEGLVGVVGFRPGDAGPWPELGYWIGRPYWGGGLATEAVRSALVWAERDWGRRAVTAGHFADNPASARVLEKAGFLYTGDRAPYRSLARREPAESRRMIWLA